MHNRKSRRPQSLKVTRIMVTDCHGDEVEIYQREHKVRVPVLGCTRKIVSYELDTGERVAALDNDTFALNGSSRTFLRIK